MATYLEIIQAVSAVGTPLIAAILFWVYEHRKEQLEKAKAFRELFNEFNIRFNKINGDLNNIRAASENNTDFPDGFENTIKDYLNLCAEEYLWTKNEYRALIKPEIWVAWQQGIRYYLEVPEIEQVFSSELNGSAKLSYYGLAQELGY